MNEFIKKLFERLEGEKQRLSRLKNDTIALSDNEVIAIEENAYNFCKEIVNQLAEEYNNGWIPVSSGRLPEDCGIHEVTALLGNGCVYTEFAYYDESKGEWWKHDDDGLVNVFAWREYAAPYQPKGD